jgi:hypothetical protein
VVKTTIKLATALFSGCLLAAGASAQPLVLSDAQMDAVAAGGMVRVEGFVCPVITTDAVFRDGEGPGGELGIEGFYTIGGPTIMVPEHATNGAGDGSNPGGPFHQPGEITYTAIWKK